MSKVAPSETLVENRTCAKCATIFAIADRDIAFYEKISPVFSGKKYMIPPPTLCPDCRQQRRLSFRNERKLYKRKCDATGKEIVSIYSPDKPYTIYDQEYWWSDAWDPMSYGREFDFERSTMEQYRELFKKIPHLGILSFATENAEYNNHVGFLKNCYYTFAGGRLEDVYYSYWMTDVHDAMDCYSVLGGNDLYECIRVEKSQHSMYLSDSQECHHSYFLSWCIGCTDCIACKNLENAQYCIGNKQYTKEAYEKNKESLTLEEMRKIFESVEDTRGESTIINSENSDGTFIIDSQEVHKSTYVKKGEYCSYVMIGENIDHVFDTNFLNGSDHLYECISGAMNHGNIACSFLNESHDCLYSIECFSSSNCFLCIGLRNASYCILNKQYTKEEYEKIVPRIIEKMTSLGEWGEFFPATLSPFGYNETVASEYYPLSKEEVVGSSPLRKGDVTEGQGDLVSGSLSGQNPPSPLSQGGMGKETLLHGPIFNWSDYEAPFPKVEKTIKASLLPEDISQIPNDILNWAIECEVSGKPFRIIKQELEFYRKHNIPIPKRHPDVRHMDRKKRTQKK